MLFLNTSVQQCSRTAACSRVHVRTAFLLSVGPLGIKIILPGAIHPSDGQASKLAPGTASLRLVVENASKSACLLALRRRRRALTTAARPRLGYSGTPLFPKDLARHAMYPDTCPPPGIAGLQPCTGVSLTIPRPWW